MDPLKPIKFPEFKRSEPKPAEPVQRAEPTAGDAKAGRRDWLVIVLLAVIAFLLVRSCDFPGPGPKPGPEPIVIDDDGRYLLFLIDESDPNAMTIEQAQAVHSVAIEDWAEKNDFDLRIFDVRDDLSKVEPVWEQIIDVADDAPSMTGVVDKKAKTGPIPEGTQATLDVLKELEQP